MPKQPLQFPPQSQQPQPIALDAVDNTADPAYSPQDENGFPLLPDPTTPPPQSPITDEYNPENWRDWVIASCDRQGHKSDMTVHVPPAVAHQVSIAVSSNRFPYRTTQELLRHALHRHLRFLAVFDRRMPSVMAQVDAMNSLLVEDQLLQEQQNVLSRMQSHVETHLGQGDTASAKRLIGAALHNIDSMPPGSWRDSYRKVFNELFAWAVEALPGEAEPRRRRRGGNGVGNGA